MTTPVIRLQQPVFTRDDVRAVTRVLASGRVGGNGPVGGEVERQLTRLLRVRHALLMTSCTHALQAALRALGIGRGDEVIMPSYAYMSMANAVLNVGARPVFVDVELAHLTIDPAGIPRAITRRTKAVLAVHYAGYPCDMRALLALKRRYGFALLEDAAQTIGTRYHGRDLGTIGDAGCLSFHETKNVACGEGGALLTQRDDLARRADVLREKGTNRTAFLRGKAPRYSWVGPGDNFVLSDLQAALLQTQLPRLARITRAHQRIGRRYMAALQPLVARGAIRLPDVDPNDRTIAYNWHLFYLLVQPPWRRDAIMASLRSEGIQATFHFVALHASPFGRRLHRGGRLSHAEQAERQLLRLPLSVGLTAAQQQRVIDAVYRAFGLRRPGR